MKIAIVVGHNPRARGAVRTTDGRTEFDWNSNLASLIHAIDRRSTKIFYRSHEGGYSQEIARVYREVDRWGADCSLELHFNAAGATANGCETLTSGTLGSRRLAGLLQRYTLDAVPVRDRGVKTLARGDRGSQSVWASRCPAVITEPYFGSNVRDCNIADDYLSALAEATYLAGADYCRLYT
jgi:N-acetylmuramoyl-L-alanine amidase